LLRLGAVFHALTYIARLAAYLRNHPVDLVHTNTLKADLLGGIAARLAGVPVLWHVRDRIDADYLPARVVRVFRWLCRWLPTYLIANSRATLETLALTRTNAAVVHDGFPGLQAPSTPSDPATPLIGLVGRITAWKGQHIFLEAAATVHRKYPGARFQIIGSAMFGEEAYEARLRRMVCDLALGDCVEFTGFRADVQELIGRLTILVHASTTGEPFGQVVIEGMAAGKPVVATRGGGVPEIVVDGETGLMVPMGEAQPMAEAIERLLSDPTRAAAMGRAGRQRVTDHFTIQHTARKVEGIYDTILGPPNGEPVRRACGVLTPFQPAQSSTSEGSS
jgi:glycosyltransferase involved in cell wall biosynthesis